MSILVSWMCQSLVIPCKQCFSTLSLKLGAFELTPCCQSWVTILFTCIHKSYRVNIFVFLFLFHITLKNKIIELCLNFFLLFCMLLVFILEECSFLSFSKMSLFNQRTEDMRHVFFFLLLMGVAFMILCVSYFDRLGTQDIQGIILEGYIVFSHEIPLSWLSLHLCLGTNVIFLY